MPNLYHRPTPSVESAKKDSEHASAVVGHPGEKRNSKSKLKASITKLSPANSLRRASKTFGSLSRKDYTSKITDPSSNLACKVTPPSNVGNVGSVPSVKLNQFDDEIEGGTDVLEVWFSGCHSGMHRFPCCCCVAMIIDYVKMFRCRRRRSLKHHGPFSCRHIPAVDGPSSSFISMRDYIRQRCTSSCEYA